MLTIAFPLAIRRTRPRQTLPSTPIAGRPPRLARLIALAHNLDGLVRTGRVKNYREMAELGHVSPAPLRRFWFC
jgi:hypothetical protein